MKARLVAAVVTVFSVLVFGFVLSACGGGSSNETGSSSSTETTAGSGSETEGDVTLTFWNEWSEEPEKAWGEETIAEFESSHPTIKIESRAIENANFSTVMRTGMSSGEPPDVIQTEANNTLSQFSRNGQIYDVSSWFKEPKNKSHFVPSGIESVSYDGKQYGFPLKLSTGTQIYYNLQILEENGIDPESLKTWPDYLAAFEKLKANGVTPVALGDKEGWTGSQWFYPFLVRTVGAKKVNQLVAGNCGYKWTEPDIVHAAELYEELITEEFVSSGAASDNFPQSQALFFSGQAAFFQTGSWLPGRIATEAPPDLKVGMSIFPTVEGGKGSLKENLVAANEALSLTSKAAEDPAKRKAAMVFMEWMTSVPVQVKAEEVLGSISATNAATGQIADPFVKQIVEEQVNGSEETITFLEYVLPNPVGEGEIWVGGTGVASGQLNATEWMEGVQSAFEKESAEVKLPAECSTS